MSDYERYLPRTEAWARKIEEPEDIVGSTGRVPAGPGDVVVIQHLRGQEYVYVMTEDDFLDDWRLPSDIDTDHATSESGTDPLPGSVPPSQESTEEDNPVDDGTTSEPPAAVPTAGTPAENPTPAAPTEGETPDTVTPDSPETSPVMDDQPAPSPTASAPTSAGSGDGDIQGTATTDVPQVGSDTPDAMSPVSGPDTPDVPAPAPDGSASSELTAAEQIGQTDQQPDQPDTTTPTQTVAPAQDPGGAGADAPAPVDDATTATPDDGGDAGAAPTPNVDNTENVNTGNDAGTAVTADSVPDITAPSADEGGVGKHEDTADVTPPPPDNGTAVPPATDDTATPAPTKALPTKSQGKTNGSAGK